MIELTLVMLLKALGIIAFGLLMAIGFNLGNMLNVKLGLVTAH
jgi:hypothetical protein